ncbi:MAG TPA: toll/interleukin-1 receptor domain-containing protein [Gammaproteobacteria bacterium]|jgi:hypothetical protein|nr:toll/interleukin-1 receptor domain-containing protein [Gammaproteobacteria bacterium]
MDFFNVFISHTSRIKKAAGELKTFLEGYGVSCFVAHDDVQVSEEWQNKIEDKIRTADAFVPILTKDFMGSEWTDQEVGIAIGVRANIFPVSADSVLPYGFIKKYQSYFPVRDGVQGDPEQWSNMFITEFGKNLFELLLKDPKTRNRMIEAMVTRIETSTNYNHTNNLMPYLSQIPQLPGTLVDHLESAYQTNSQVSGAFKAENLPALIVNWRSILQ